MFTDIEKLQELHDSFRNDEFIREWPDYKFNCDECHKSGDPYSLGVSVGIGRVLNRLRSFITQEIQKEDSLHEFLCKAGVKVYRDGNQWCILKCNNIQEGICGFGDTIEDALYELLKDM